MKQDKKKEIKYMASLEQDSILYEMILDREKKETYYVSMENKNVIKASEFDFETYKVLPFSADHDLITHKAILFPSEPIEYGSEGELLETIQAFIHQYLEVSPFYEKIAAHYVLFTWMYDKFNELPYLRAIGDYGTGKSQFLKVIGHLCYRPMITMGATTTAPIFRIINQFKGTLILDEADLQYSDTTNDMVKVLNMGFQSGTAILRCVGENFDVQAFNVFGPKIVATRQKFADQALESRFLIERMDGSLTREDITLNLGPEFEEKALEIRNKCLYWRLENYSKEFSPVQINDKSIEPRLRQIIGPLCGIIQNEKMKTELISFVQKYNAELREDRGISDEGEVLDVLIQIAEGSTDDIPIAELRRIYNQKLILMNQRDYSHKKVGYLVRNTFQMKTKRIRDGYVITRESYDRQIKKLKVKYDIEGEHVNLVNNATNEDHPFVKEVRALGYPNL